MFKHILIPTDGSAVAAKAVKAGVTFAKEIGARITGYYAVDPGSHYAVYGEGYMFDSKFAAELERRAVEIGKRGVATIGKAAKAAGVPPAGDEGTLALRGYHRCGEIAELRRDLYGVERTPRHLQADHGERHQRGADALPDPGARLSLVQRGSLPAARARPAASRMRMCFCCTSIRRSS